MNTAILPTQPALFPTSLQERSSPGQAIRVRGLVQGVGFRPMVWHLAQECGVTGMVWNDAEGLMIHARGETSVLSRFIERLHSEAPPLARIDTIECVDLDEPVPNQDFRIIASTAGSVHTGIVPDAATCPRCRAEIVDPGNRRYRYPLTNCTHCGPRLSIIYAIPYDRANTSMAVFTLCPECQTEYADPADRRFHAQPNACPRCGPQLRLEARAGESVTMLTPVDPLTSASQLLQQGAIVAIKGIGGFHLACDATNAETVARLRERKRRDAKPFALMAKDLDVIRQYCSVSVLEQQLLESPAAPIVILDAAGPRRVADAVAPDQRTLGFMLPYTPLHHLLLQSLQQPVVLTSGNYSDAPQCIDDNIARETLTGIADYLLVHNRVIVNRVDDSVARVMDTEPRLLRRARGYAPAPLKLPAGFEDTPPILALGGELKNTFCLLRDGQAILSQHMGDLEDAASYAGYSKNLTLFQTLFEHKPQTIAIDRHPEYLSAKLGQEWAGQQGLRLEAIQHHHAHIAAGMAEHKLPLDTQPVLGIALDGLGYGEDGTLWGGEFLQVDYRHFNRLGTFKPVALPGGFQAIREPWRNTYAHLATALGWGRYADRYRDLELTRYLQTKPLTLLDGMLQTNINSPLASSCGRLFDAVAAALGLHHDRVSYEGQAAVALEAQVDTSSLDREEGYPFAFDVSSALIVLDPTPMWEALLNDLADLTAISVMATRFHLGLAHAVAKMAAHIIQANKREPIDTVVLSGGVFQNRILLECVARALRETGYTVIAPRQVPANDGGLSLGQAVIAAARELRKQQCIARGIS